MKNLKKLLFAATAIGVMALSGCLHIIEEVTFKDKGNGSYAMRLDMSEVKSMMELLKSMSTDSTGGEMNVEEDDSMSQMGEEISGIASTLKGVQGITNVVELKDTSTFMFGYSFDFADVTALNRALKILNKEKAALGYKDDFQDERKEEDFFKYHNKTFERLPTGDLGEEMRKALAESSEEEEEDAAMTMDMMKMMFAEMSYKQVYHFPDHEIKKSNNELGELSDNNHTLTVTLKPFDEEQAKKKATVATEVKLK
jgi:hypothetical protein